MVDKKLAYVKSRYLAFLQKAVLIASYKVRSIKNAFILLVLYASYYMNVTLCKAFLTSKAKGVKIYWLKDIRTCNPYFWNDW